MKQLLSKITLTLLIGACDFGRPYLREISKAQTALGERDYDKAAKLYEQVLERPIPKDIFFKVNYQLGKLYSTVLGRPRESIPFFRSAIKSSRDPIMQIKASEELGRISFEYLFDYETSINIYKRLSSFRPKLKDSDLFEWRYALSLRRFGEIEKAIKSFRSITLNKGHKYGSDALFLLGVIEFERGKWKKAIGPLSKYISLKVSNSSKQIEARYLLANSYEELELLGKAYALYYSLRGEYPNTTVLEKRLSSLYERRVARKR